VPSNVSLNHHFAGLVQGSEQEIKRRGFGLARTVARIWPRPGGGPGYIAPAPTPPEPEELFGQSEAEAGGVEWRGGSKLHIRVRWSKLGKALPDEEICEKRATTTMAVFLGRLIRIFGEPMADRLTRIRFVRGKGKAVTQISP
jgi:hypothetical protein